MLLVGTTDTTIFNLLDWCSQSVGDVMFGYFSAFNLSTLSAAL